MAVKNKLDEPEVQTQTDAEVRRDARDAGISVARVQYGDPRAPQHWCVARIRDGSRLSKSFTSETAAWEAVPDILSELALARETAQREEQERQANYRTAATEQRLNAAKLPAELQGITFDDFPASKILDVAKKCVAEFEDRLRDGKGLVLVGGGGITKLKIAAAILTEVCKAGWSGRFMTVFDVELCEVAGISAITTPDLLVLACYEAGPTIRAVFKARGNKPTVLVASCSLDRLKDLVLNIFDPDPLGLEAWTQMERKAEIVEFPRGEK